MSIATLTLTILSHVNNEFEVFNHLIRVRREDTGEEGLLLCSHCCRWPKDKIPKATWLEGCFTPDEYKDDPRLLMGYHPHSLTKWEVEGKTLTLAVRKQSASVGQPLNIDFWAPAPAYGREGYLTNQAMLERFPQRSRFFHKLWAQAQEGREDEGAQILAYFRMVDASPLPVWVKRMASYHLPQRIQFALEFRGTWLRRYEACSFCEEYVDELRVVVDDEGEGYMRAVNVNTQSMIEQAQQAFREYLDSKGVVNGWTISKEDRTGSIYLMYEVTSESLRYPIKLAVNLTALGRAGEDQLMGFVADLNHAPSESAGDGLYLRWDGSTITIS